MKLFSPHLMVCMFFNVFLQFKALHLFITKIRKCIFVENDECYQSLCRAFFTSFFFFFWAKFESSCKSFYPLVLSLLRYFYSQLNNLVTCSFAKLYLRRWWWPFSAFIYFRFSQKYKKCINRPRQLYSF